MFSAFVSANWLRLSGQNYIGKTSRKLDNNQPSLTLYADGRVWCTDLIPLTTSWHHSCQSAV